ncbi:aspartate aminotransferase family protein [Salinibacterium sp. NSLL150]|uniref:aspartate aminotransferase family protein n=1 Tax=unclassified Salinibacterium TaxID=2632331 RepID=UPI0018CE1658|nr:MULTISPECIES: aspartate aminotransferase family protein [unclassified Salinibacterium]MBH0097909.1 aspartate aminotransferase family protein [Salinibacterium sp. NSLL35]MBH0100664.1 aspartate aminotransferase family protein [Salinibacterium sp. NSLL150]MBH0103423.1 aspartate aminotransferase family protein [Salinibacterium sp. NSLL16]MBH0106184.1 aspartate aminotransferase family protein [Salinibacterium sp. NSLL17]
MTEQNTPDLDAYALELDQAHIFHSWSAQTPAHAAAVSIKSGLGTRVWDHAGNEYLDFSSQHVNVNLGHQHPALLEAIRVQSQLLATISPPTANITRGEAAKRLAAIAPEGFNRVFFTNGGSDANENAMRMARLYTGRDKILSAYRSYHGNTGSSIVATGDPRRIPNEFARGHVHFFGPYLYRSEFWATTPEQESERALQHLRRVIEAEGAETIAAVLLEPVPGTPGIMLPPPGYLAGVRELCDQHGILLIFDEVMCGFGRTGEWFAFDAFDARPDLITFAKGVNSGYVPIGGVIIDDPIAAHFNDRVFPGGLTYSGHPLAAATVVASLDTIASEGVLEHVRDISENHLGPALEALAERHPSIGEVRGRGVFWALELVTDRATREPVPAATMGRIRAGLVERGLLPFVAENRIHVLPPCVVTPTEIAEAMEIYDAVLTLELG